jgi:hypothetical protein
VLVICVRQNYRAREVKTVTVDSTGHFLKLLLHEPHNNWLNTDKRVGLISLSVQGVQELLPAHSGAGLVPTLLAEDGALMFTHDAGLDAHFMQLGLDPSSAMRGIIPLGGLRGDQPVMIDTPSGITETAAPQPPPVPLPEVLRTHDQFFAETLRSLGVEKAVAVATEDFDRARTLKAGRDEVASLKELVDQAEDSKGGCVAAEDYDGAIRCKEQIAAYISRCQAVLAGLAAQPPSEDGGGGGGGESSSPGSGGAPRPSEPEADVAPRPALLDAQALEERRSLVELFGQHGVECLSDSRAELRLRGLQVSQTAA